jgi:hypothetical protein
MQGLTTSLLAHACQTFLRLAYPEGTVPEKCRRFLNLSPDTPLQTLLDLAVCERLPSRLDGSPRGYAFRLGSATFPHVKLQVIWDEECASLVFAVDTHDAITLPSDHPDHEPLRALKERNRVLKETIERAWEQEGLLTFRKILEQGLALPQVFEGRIKAFDPDQRTLLLTDPAGRDQTFHLHSQVRVRLGDRDGTLGELRADEGVIVRYQSQGSKLLAVVVERA